jgi:hypothetical protein
MMTYSLGPTVGRKAMRRSPWFVAACFVLVGYIVTLAPADFADDIRLCRS